MRRERRGGEGRGGNANEKGKGRLSLAFSSRINHSSRTDRGQNAQGRGEIFKAESEAEDKNLASRPACPRGLLTSKQTLYTGPSRATSGPGETLSRGPIPHSVGLCLEIERREGGYMGTGVPSPSD